MCGGVSLCHHQFTDVSYISYGDLMTISNGQVMATSGNCNDNW